jgi:16S rRNA (guanine527-N7)-methyltransferase
MTGEKARQQLIAGLAELDLAVTSAEIDGLIEYVALLQRWNKRINLIGATDDLDVINRHILDSLSVQRFVRGPRLADIGSGAGLPGIPLAICNSALHVTLLDSRQRRCDFVQHVAHSLRLVNVDVVCCRVENYRPTEKFDTLVARALTQLDRFVSTTCHLLNAGGQWLAMKGQYPQQELSMLSSDAVAPNYGAGFRTKTAAGNGISDRTNNGLLIEVVPLQVPGLAAARHVVRIQFDNNAPTEADKGGDG